jgi:hypothetical protein
MMLGHTIAMGKGVGRAAVVALCASALLAPAPVFAEPSPTPTPTTTLNPFEQFRIDREAYLEAMKVRSQQMRLINNVFKESCDKAARDYKFAMASARTPDQKNSAATIRKNAVSAAIVARDYAIAELGAEPVAPVEPAKPLKVSNKKKPR